MEKIEQGLSEFAKELKRQGVLKAKNNAFIQDMII